MAPLLQLAVFLLLAAVLLCVFRAFNRLVRLEYERFAEDWERDGRPYVVYARRAPGMSRTWRAGLAAHRRMFAWLFVTPAWARQSAEAEQSFRYYRFLVLAWSFVAVPLYGLLSMLIVYLNW
jgi:hypothetical protein